MQHGDRPLLQTTVRHETIGGKSAWVAVIKIGLYTTIELSMPQLMALSDSLQRIREAWMEQELHLRAQIPGASHKPVVTESRV